METFTVLRHNNCLYIIIRHFASPYTIYAHCHATSLSRSVYPMASQSLEIPLAMAFSSLYRAGHVHELFQSPRHQAWINMFGLFQINTFSYAKSCSGFQSGISFVPIRTKKEKQEKKKVTSIVFASKSIAKI